MALPDAPLDYAAIGEAALLRSGKVPGLQLVWKNADWDLWKVVGSPGLVLGPARLISDSSDRVSLEVGAPGAVTVRVRWSTYWTVSSGAGCLTESPAGWTVLHARRAGAVTISASLLHPGAGCPAASGRD